MALRKGKTGSPIRWLWHKLLVIAGAAALTFACFFVLPFMQAIAKPPADDMTIRSVATAEIPPPPAPPEEQPEEEPEEAEPEPELAEEQQPLDYEQLKLAMSGGLGDGGGAGVLNIDLGEQIARNKQTSEGLFRLDELDQRPRVIYQPSPRVTPKARARTPGWVYVLFVVDTNGSTQKAIVQKSSDPALEAPALGAVKRWRFDPGKRNGKPVRFRMRVPIKFPDMKR